MHSDVQSIKVKTDSVEIEISSKLWTRIQQSMAAVECPTFEAFLSRATWMYETIGDPKARKACIVYIPQNAFYSTVVFTKEDLIQDNRAIAAELRNLKLPPPPPAFEP